MTDISWAEHSHPEASRISHSSAVLGNNQLYLLGGRGVKSTEFFNKTTGQWTNGFGLKSNVHFGCAVQVAQDTVVTIAGNGERSRLMHSYNISSGTDPEQYDTVKSMVSENRHAESMSWLVIHKFKIDKVCKELHQHSNQFPPKHTHTYILIKNLCLWTNIPTNTVDFFQPKEEW